MCCADYIFARIYSSGTYNTTAHTDVPSLMQRSAWATFQNKELKNIASDDVRQIKQAPQYNALECICVGHRARYMLRVDVQAACTNCDDFYLRPWAPILLYAGSTNANGWTACLN